MPVLRAEVSAAPLDVAEIVSSMTNPRDGAVAVFVGRVRDHDPEVSGLVAAIDYTGHPDAGRILSALADAALAEADPSGEAGLVVVHRLGRLEVGDVVFVACASMPHRAEAFALCETVVERVKAELPIWKKQLGQDGSHVWSGLTSPASSSRHDR